MANVDIKLKLPENIPVRHLVFLGLLLAVYAGAGTLGWMEVRGHVAELEREKNRIAADMGKKQRKLRTIEERIATLESKRALYESLHDNGFIGSPERLQGIAALRETANAHRVFDLEYSFKPRQTLALAHAPDKEREVLSTPLKVTVLALLDSDVYAFLERLREELPGQVMLRDMELSRRGGVDRGFLDRVRNGQKPARIKGTLNLRWNTLRWPALKQGTEESGETS